MGLTAVNLQMLLMYGTKQLPKQMATDRYNAPVCSCMSVDCTATIIVITIIVLMAMPIKSHDNHSSTAIINIYND